MHPAPAHLESKLRFWDFSVGQLAAAFAGIMLGVVWAKFISPLHGMLDAMSGAYIAALPVIPVFVASQTEFDLCGLVAGALRWRRRDGRYVPGAGENLNGYLLSVEHADTDLAGDPGNGDFDLRALWEEPSPSREAPTTPDSDAPFASVRQRRPTDRGAAQSDRHSRASNARERR